MAGISLFYATNRKHEGKHRWRPEGYGSKFSDDGMENLRFGRLTIPADPAKIAESLQSNLACGPGDGEGLSEYLTEQAESAAIRPYREKLDRGIRDVDQKGAVLGSAAFFRDLRNVMMGGSDALVYIHGFNVSWHDAVGAAGALQEMLNRDPQGRPTAVILFTWPSDGLALPFVSYKSDRTEAQGSGYAVGRAFLKLRDYLVTLNRQGGPESVPCGRNIHLLCHSMGNFVLQNALERLRSFTPHSAHSRIFEHLFLCAPDVDDSVLEPGQPLGDLHELGRQVTIYYNRGDAAMYVSDYTKGNPERLGTNGAARPTLLHAKVHQVDCSPVVSGVVEHSYYLSGAPNQDIRLSVRGLSAEESGRPRVSQGQKGVWMLKSIS